MRFSSYTTTFDEYEMFIVEAALRHFELARDPQAPWGLERGDRENPDEALPWHVRNQPARAGRGEPNECIAPIYFHHNVLFD